MRKQIVAAFLSALLPGAGQLYFHQWMKGGLFLLVALFLSGTARRAALGGSSLGQALPFLGNSLFLHGILLALALWSVVDLFWTPQRPKKR